MVTNKVQQPIKVAVVGMDERSVSRMATIFKIVYKGRCEFAQGNDAQLVVIDLDFEPNAWEKYQRDYPGLPAIVMSTTLTEIEGATYVAKPAKLNLLWDSIFNLMVGLPLSNESEVTEKTATIEPPAVLSQSSQPASPGKAAPSKPNANTAASAIDNRLKTTKPALKVVQRNHPQDETSQFYNPNEYLLGHILSALKNNTSKQGVIHVQCWRDRRLILQPSKGLAYTDLTHSQLKNIGTATVNDTFAVEISNNISELSASEASGLESMSMDYLIWDLALRTARGRVPLSTDLSVPLYLRHWPNFPRLPHTPHAMRIAALWVDNPSKLSDIAHQLGIEPTDVYSFYSAAVATNLMGPAKRQADSLLRPRQVTKEKTPKRGLLASIMRRISK